MLRPSGLVLLAALLSLVSPACVYDGAQRCGPHQSILDNDRCACEMGYVPGASGCVPCGEAEREVNGVCVCVKGYARPADGAACEIIPATLGATCDTDSAPCPADSRYPLCHVTDGTSGYCTSACAGSDDCDGGYKCHEDGADGFCRRPPLGYNDMCKTDDDCAAGEATFCETIQQHVCLVPCSAGKTDVCFEGEACCDFVLFHPICVPAAACVANSGTVIQ